MQLALLLAPILFAQAPPAPGQANPPESCVTCHQPEPGGHYGGHGPYEAGNCSVCHVENAKLNLVLDPAASTPLVVPTLMGGPSRVASPDTQFKAPRPLVLRDPAPARHRGVQLDPGVLEGADYLWVRQGRGSWQTVPIEAVDTGYTRPLGEPEIQVEQRVSALGTVAVVTVVADAPIGAQVAHGGRQAGTTQGYFSSELSLRLPLGHEPPAVLPVEIWTQEGERSLREVRLADASARIERLDPNEQPRVKINWMMVSASDGYLEVLTPDPVKLEIRAPSRQELAAEQRARIANDAQPKRVRFADTAPEASAGAAADPAAGLATRSKRVPHPELAPIEYAGTTACLSCHPGANAHGASHPLVRPKVGGGYVWPEDLPLGRDGRMQCITCHQPHGSKEFGFHARKDGRRDLCISCHAEPR